MHLITIFVISHICCFYLLICQWLELNICMRDTDVWNGVCDYHYFFGFLMNKKISITIPSQGCVVINAEEEKIVATADRIPMCERSIMYRNGSKLIFRPIRDNEIIGTPELLRSLSIRAGCQVD